MDIIVLYIKGIEIFLSFISRLLWFRERSAGGFLLIACTFPSSSIKARPPFPLTIYSTAATREEDLTGDKTQARKNRKRIRIQLYHTRNVNSELKQKDCLTFEGHDGI